MPPPYSFASLGLIAALAQFWPMAEVISWPWRWLVLAKAYKAYCVRARRWI